MRGSSGPFGACPDLHPLIKRIKLEVPDLSLNVWYLDEGTLMGLPKDLAAALTIIESISPSIGLHLNWSKSLIYIPEDADASQFPLPADIPITHRGFTLFGCPVGPPDFCEEVFQDTVGALQDVCDSQLEIAFLRSFMALPKVAPGVSQPPPSPPPCST